MQLERGPVIDLEGKTIVVIGGSGGLGRVIVETLVRCGARVGFSYRSNRAAAQALLDAAGGDGRHLAAYPLSLGTPNAAAAFLDTVAQEVGPIDAVIHTAGADIALDYVADIDPASFHQAIEDDLVGFFSLVKAAIPHLRNSRGALVALTSAGVARHPQRDVLSTAPKAGMEALVRAVAREEGRFGVRANSVGVGSVQAGLWHRLAERVPEGFMDAAARNTALRRHGTAEEIANIAVFLASPAAGFVTGQSIAADGGYSV